MKIRKPHFWYYKSQRNGVLFLVVVLVCMQLLYSFINFSKANDQFFTVFELTALQLKIDSLKKVKNEGLKKRVLPFNPNYLTDYKASQLGLTIEEIDRLLAFRKQDRFVNSIKDFQKVTKVSDSVLHNIAPFFKFPDWVQKKQVIHKERSKASQKSESIFSIDVNLATVDDFLLIKGVTQYYAKRIVSYRNRLQGFSKISQITEVWGLNTLVAERIINTFKVVNKPAIKKVNVNTATFKEVLSNPYIDFELCKKIFNYRDEVAELQSVEEIKKIEGFPIDKYERIILYLEAK